MGRDVLERICEMRRLGFELLVVDVVLLVLLIMSFPFIEPRSSTYYVAIFSFVIILSTLAVFGTIVAKCYQMNAS